MESPVRFIDLFAGIGGTRLGFEMALEEEFGPFVAESACVFSSEWDRFAQQTYKANFGETPAGDIRSIPVGDIPDHEILVAGFPCQPFSIAGVSKKNALGRPHGFLDQTQGTLFFEIARILQEKHPKAFLLENVRNLKTHDAGRTFETIINTLELLDYTVIPRVLDASSLVPQKRQRIYIVGFRNDLSVDFSWPALPDNRPVLGSILEREVDAKYTLTDHLWTYLQQYELKHRSAGNGFGYGLVGPDDQARTLSARYYKDGSEILIRQSGRNPRRLTPRECARLMGFPDDFKIEVSDTQAYKQFGNSVVVPMVKLIAGAIIKCVSQPAYRQLALTSA